MMVLPVRWSSGPRIVSVVGVLAFWVGVFLAGSLVNEYSAREDYISFLAGRGSPVAALAISAMLANAVAHLATAVAVLRGWGARLLAALLAAAGMAMMAVAVFRQACPDGPPACGVPDLTATDWVDVVHAVSVSLYQLFTLVAMLTLTIVALRRNSAPPRWLGWLTLAFATGSMTFVAQSVGDLPGLWQRLWLATNLAWLLVVAWTATARSGIGTAR
jgi:Protein of unknown function (DUF998)